MRLQKEEGIRNNVEPATRRWRQRRLLHDELRTRTNTWWGSHMTADSRADITLPTSPRPSFFVPEYAQQDLSSEARMPQVKAAFLQKPSQAHLFAVEHSSIRKSPGQKHKKRHTSSAIGHSYANILLIDLQARQNPMVRSYPPTRAFCFSTRSDAGSYQLQKYFLR